MPFFNDEPYSYQIIRLKQEVLPVEKQGSNGQNAIGVKCTIQPMAIIGFCYKNPEGKNTPIRVDRIGNARVVLFPEGTVEIGDKIWIQYFY